MYGESMVADKETLYVVFTDLDGCLLDHETYDHRPALAAFNRLGALNIPVIPVSSKTGDEIAALDIPFGSVPVISEGGMVTAIPEGFLPPPYNDPQLIVEGARYEAIISFINELPAPLRAGIRGFHDMTDAEVAAMTGLSHVEAQRARARAASEPFLWSGSDDELNKLTDLARQNALWVTKGGRFHHLMGRGGKRGAALRVVDLLAAHHPRHSVVSIALGDSENDAEMLAAVDYGIIVPNPHGSGLQIDAPFGEIITAPEAGPTGWGMAVLSLLARLGVTAPCALK